MPRRSVTPGRKPSMRASADSTSLSTVWTPSGFLRSTPIERRPRFRTSTGGFDGSPPRTACERSTRRTSAPMSERSMAANGPGPMPAISMILMPLSGPDMGWLLGSGRDGGSREAVEDVDDLGEGGTGEAVAHAFDDEVLRAGDGGGGRLATARLDERVVAAVDHERRDVELPELLGPVAGRPDRQHLP